MKASPGFLVVVFLFLVGAISGVDANACTAGSTIPSVTICSPGSTSGSPIHVTAAGRASTAISYMAVWMDGVKMYQVHSNTVDTSFPASTGTHRITVQAKDSNGTTYASKVYTTVGSSGTPTANWSISGSISPATAGTSVALSGAKTASTTTNTSGAYSFTGLSNGTYTVAPSAASTTFSPTTKSVSISGANVTGVNFSAATNSGHSVSLNWSASTTSTVSGYKVYRSLISGGPYALLNGVPITSTIYSDTNVGAGSTYYYVVTAVDSAGRESAYSGQAKASVPTP